MKYGANVLLDDLFCYPEIEWIIRCIAYTTGHADLPPDTKRFLERLCDEIGTQYDVIRNAL